MRTPLITALAAVAAALVLLASVGEAVDVRRAQGQRDRAPTAVKTHSAGTAAASFDGSFGWSAGSAGVGGPRTRGDAGGFTTSAAPPLWDDSNQPFNDPLRSIQSYNDSFNPRVSVPEIQRQRWRLGIYPRATDTGVVIREVVPGSAAERAGLEVNDRLVSIGGYQVGYVGDALFECSDEFERRADENGWVRALVQNNRDGSLMSMPIQLDPRFDAISGTVAFRDRTALPRDAILTVEVREQMRSGLQPVTLTQQQFPVTRQPVPFSLEYDPTPIEPGRRFTLHATISAAGRPLLTTRVATPVLDGRSTDDIRLTLEAASSYGGDDRPNQTDPMRQIRQWFRTYLGREPRAQELFVWESHFSRGGSLADAQLQILSMPEFYYQAGANDGEYVRRMFHLVANRQPSQGEVDDWVARLRYHNRLRSAMAREFLAKAQQQAARQR